MSIVMSVFIGLVILIYVIRVVAIELINKHQKQLKEEREREIEYLGCTHGEFKRRLERSEEEINRLNTNINALAGKSSFGSKSKIE